MISRWCEFRKRDTSLKGIMMTGLRFAAAAVLAFILCLAWDGGGVTAFAQFQRAAPATGRPPTAAPSGAPAEAAPLAAPAGTGGAHVGGLRSESEGGFTPVGRFPPAE